METKFKVGDKVQVEGKGKVGTITRIETAFGLYFYRVKDFEEVKNPPVFGESILTLAEVA